MDIIVVLFNSNSALKGMQCGLSWLHTFNAVILTVEVQLPFTIFMAKYHNNIIACSYSSREVLD